MNHIQTDLGNIIIAVIAFFGSGAFYKLVKEFLDHKIKESENSIESKLIAQVNELEDRIESMSEMMTSLRSKSDHLSAVIDAILKAISCGIQGDELIMFINSITEQSKRDGDDNE